MSHNDILEISGPLPLFQPEMRQANREGRKGMTRRGVKLPKAKGLEFRFEGAWKDGGPESPFKAGEYLHIPFRCLADGEDGWEHETFDRLFCPYGLPGQIRYMREPIERNGKLARYSDTGDRVISRITGKPLVWRWPSSRLTSMLMPAEAARWFARIGEIRAERLQDISEEDAIAEGIEPAGRGMWRNHDPMSRLGWIAVDDPRMSYMTLWESINGRDSWWHNPWVWVIEFRRIKP